MENNISSKCRVTLDDLSDERFSDLSVLAIEIDFETFVDVFAKQHKIVELCYYDEVTIK
jgi:hypothetical protein